MQPFRPGAVGQEGEKTAAHTGSETERVGHCGAVERQDSAGGGRRGNRADNASRVKAAGMETSARYGAKPPRNLITDCDGRCDRIETRVGTLGCRERGSHHDAAGMHHRVSKRIVEIARVCQAAMHQRRNRR